MYNFIVKTFVKNFEDVKNPKVRENYGSVAGAVGIISNVILCTIKILAGAIFKSIAILADGINNLSDASASLITLFGFKLAAKKPDKDHPYGHGRTEYLTGLAISLMIILIGFSLFKTSLEKTIHPEPIEFSFLSIIILVISIAIKIWQAGFNKKVGQTISSDALLATAADSRNDVMSTSAVLLSTLVGTFTSWNIDGPMGIVVSLFILWAGVSLVKETIAPILGEAPDPEIVKEMSQIVLSDKSILGIHDVIVHDYGPGRLFASLHVEVDGAGDIFEIHDTVDNLENKVMNEMGILLTIHMDPVVVGDPLVDQAKADLEDLIKGIEGVINVHDVRVVQGPTHINVVFDAVKTDRCKLEKDELKALIAEKLKSYNPKYVAVSTIDDHYL